MSEPLPPVTAQQEQEEAASLRHLLAIILESRWRISGIAAGFLAAGILYVILTPPIYKADSLVQVEQQNRVIPGLDELKDALGGAETPSQAEIEILRSRTVIGRVVESQGLDVIAAPRRFPLLGAFVARQSERGERVSAWPGFGRFAWGGEYITLGRLSVPPQLEDTPLILRAGQNGTFVLEDEKGNLLAQGVVDKPVVGTGDHEKATIFVRELVAAAGTEFILVKRPFDLVVADLQGQLKVSERGKQSGILIVALEGEDAGVTAAIVNGIVSSYLRQNVERRSEEASLMLAFLDKQLPSLKDQLETAEVELREHKSGKGSAVDISVAGQELLNRTTDIEKQISELELQRSELRMRYTDQHPILNATAQKLKQLGQVRAEISKQFETLPGTELESVRYLRNVSVSNELYLQLLNRSQELKVAKAGTVGNARILDPAIVPREPIHPRAILILVLSLVLGLVVGVLSVFVLQALRSTLHRQEEIEEQFGLTVYASIPESQEEARLARKKIPKLLSRVDTSDPAVEGLRSLRTSLQFALLETGKSVIAIHGATPSVGKSFVASNLAALLADEEGPVLMIDADLRKGHLHKRMGLPREPGLVESLSGVSCGLDAAREIEAGKLFLLTTGKLPPNPADVLKSPQFERLLAMAQERFRYVILDCPPLLNLADAMILARHATANFLIARAGMSTGYDLRVAAKRFRQNEVPLRGVIFNGFDPRQNAYYYGSKYYSYRYEPATQP